MAENGLHINEISNNAIEVVVAGKGSWLISYTTVVAYHKLSGCSPIIIRKGQPESRTTGKHIAACYGESVKDMLKSGRAVMGDIPPVFTEPMYRYVVYSFTKKSMLLDPQADWCFKLVDVVSGKVVEAKFSGKERTLGQALDSLDGRYLYNGRTVETDSLFHNRSDSLPFFGETPAELHAAIVAALEDPNTPTVDG